jgi:hypothetical protein
MRIELIEIFAIIAALAGMAFALAIAVGLIWWGTP